MDEADYLALLDNVDDHGQRDPIVIFEGMVLDGYNRQKVCLQIGIEPKTVQFDGDDPAEYVLSKNLHRRHLTPSQRASAVVACRAWVRSGANQHTLAGGVEAASTPQTNADMARLARVTERSITDAKSAHAAGLGERVKCPPSKSVTRGPLPL